MKSQVRNPEPPDSFFFCSCPLFPSRRERGKLVCLYVGVLPEVPESVGGTGNNRTPHVIFFPLSVICTCTGRFAQGHNSSMRLHFQPMAHGIAEAYTDRQPLPKYAMDTLLRMGFLHNTRPRPRADLRMSPDLGYHCITDGDTHEHVMRVDHRNAGSLFEIRWRALPRTAYFPGWAAWTGPFQFEVRAPGEFRPACIPRESDIHGPRPTVRTGQYAVGLRHRWTLYFHEREMGGEPWVFGVGYVNPRGSGCVARAWSDLPLPVSKC